MSYHFCTVNVVEFFWCLSSKYQNYCYTKYFFKIRTQQSPFLEMLSLVNNNNNYYFIFSGSRISKLHSNNLVSLTFSSFIIWIVCKTVWHTIIEYVSCSAYLIRYVLQVTLYKVWRERNGRRHGEAPKSATCLVGWIDKQVQNQVSSIRIMGDRRYDKSLQVWFKSKD